MSAPGIYTSTSLISTISDRYSYEFAGESQVMTYIRLDKLEVVKEMLTSARYFNIVQRNELFILRQLFTRSRPCMFKMLLQEKVFKSSLLSMIDCIFRHAQVNYIMTFIEILQDIYLVEMLHIEGNVFYYTMVLDLEHDSRRMLVIMEYFKSLNIKIRQIDVDILARENKIKDSLIILFKELCTKLEIVIPK